MAQLTEIKPEELKNNPFQLIGKDWMLVTAKEIAGVDFVCHILKLFCHTEFVHFRPGFRHVSADPP